MQIITETKKTLCLSFSGVKNVYWKYRRFLTDPRIFFEFEDGGTLMSLPLGSENSPASIEQEFKRYIEEKTDFPDYLCNVVSVDWKYGKNVNDKRLVFYCEDGETYISGPLPKEMNVPLVAQSFFTKDWIEGEKG
jgi:hypothetical protein